MNIHIKTDYKLNKGLHYLSQLKLKKSLIRIEEAKKYACEYFGKSHPNYIYCCFGIGLNLHFQGYQHEALDNLKRVLEQFQTMDSYLSCNCSSVLFYMAEIYKEKGDASSSLKCYKRSLQILNKLSLQNTYRTKRTILGIAYVYLNQGKTQQFFYYLKKDRDLKAEHNIGKHIYRYTYYMVIGHYYAMSRNWEACKKIYMKYLKVYKSSEQFSSSTAIQIMANLACYEFRINEKSSKVDKLFSLCKQFYEDLLDKGHIFEKNTLAIQILRVKAIMYKRKGKTDDYLRTLRTILKFQKQFNKEYDREMWLTYLNISFSLLNSRMFRQSLQVSKKALKIELKTFKNPFYYLILYEAIGFAYYNLKSFDKALKYFKKIAHIQKALGRNTDDNSKLNYHRIGVCYMLQNQVEKAYRKFTKALCMSKLSTKMSLEETCMWNNMGYLCTSMRMFHEAQVIFKFCMDNARTNKFDHRNTQMFIYNFQEVERAIETTKNSTRDNLEQKLKDLQLELKIGALRNEYRE